MAANVTKHSQFVDLVNGMPRINLGALRHTLTIQQAGVSGTYDSSGVKDTAWTNVATGVQAAIGTQGVKQPDDVIKNGETVTQLFLEVAFYYQAFPTLAPNMRFVAENGSTYLIKAVENVLEMDVVWVVRCLALGTNT